jgi:hypothetical protein
MQKLELKLKARAEMKTFKVKILKISKPTDVRLS